MRKNLVQSRFRYFTSCSSHCIARSHNFTLRYCNCTLRSSYFTIDSVTNTSNDYTYDDNGNMLSDLNKAITNITYNHLNLPTSIEFEGTLNRINYLYNAAGQKVRKSVIYSDSIKVVDYLDGFQYAGGILQFFPHAEGYVKATEINESPTIHEYAFNYVFNYTDHLGNVRLSFTKDPATQQLKIMEENHYYPFGLKHSVYAAATPLDFKESPTGPGTTILTNVLTTSYQYKYNGKELQDELGLGWYDYHARNYDPALGRWNVIDPMAPKYFSHSPYTYTLNNPVYFIDPDGMQVTNGDPDDDDIYNENNPVILKTADVGSKKSSSSSWAYIPRAFRNFDIGRNVFGYNYEKHAQLYKDPNWLAGYTKMNEAKREGEWAVVGLFASAVALPYAVSYGTLALESQYGAYIIRASVDAGSQYIVKGEVDLKQTAINGIIPTSSAKNLTVNVLSNAGNNFYENYTTTNKDGTKLSLGQNLQETTIKAITGGLLNGIGIPAGAVKSTHSYGNWFDVVTGLPMGVGSSFMDTQIENNVRD